MFFHASLQYPQGPLNTNHNNHNNSSSGSSCCAPRHCLNRRWCEPGLADDRAPAGVYTFHRNIRQTLHRKQTPEGLLRKQSEVQVTSRTSSLSSYSRVLRGCQALPAGFPALNVTRYIRVLQLLAEKWTVKSNGNFIFRSDPETSADRPIDWQTSPSKTATRPWTSHRVHLRNAPWTA